MDDSIPSKKDGERPNVATVQASINDKGGSRLLSLPADIRVMIYEYTLILDGDIWFPQGLGGPYHQQPATLQVNKQVRNETVSIYYNQNYFVWPIVDFDAPMYVKWCNSSSHRLKARKGWQLSGKRHWVNLLAWPSVVYQRKARDPIVPREGWSGIMSDRILVARQLFQTIIKMGDRHQPWEQVQEYLEDTHKIVVAANGAWERKSGM